MMRRASDALQAVVFAGVHCITAIILRHVKSFTVIVCSIVYFKLVV